jgi:hypothetical protein
MSIGRELCEAARTGPELVDLSVGAAGFVEGAPGGGGVPGGVGSAVLVVSVSENDEPLLSLGQELLLKMARHLEVRSRGTLHAECYKCSVPWKKGWW